MERNIQVSTDVFALIWAARKPGEDNEDAILRRVFKAPLESGGGASPQAKTGYRDARYGVDLPEGFTIFRNFNGTDYEAKAKSGSWVLMTTGQSYPSLNELSRAIGASENAWNGWRYKDAAGTEKPLDGLRDKSRVRRRQRKTVTSLAELGL